MPKRILVFPCGSEIGLEIHRSMCFSTHFDLIGASSVDDHGRFVYKEYVPDIPFHQDDDFVGRITGIVRDYHIDAIYPTMDAVAETLNNIADKIECVIIGSPPTTTAICASKKATYALLRDHLPTPYLHTSLDTVTDYPIFIKPDRGYGSRNTQLVTSLEAAQVFLKRPQSSEMLLLEYLPGREWTIDCFSDRYGVLRFQAARGRNRISNGISVNTKPSDEFSANFAQWAQLINKLLKPRGAWFFQAKEDECARPKLLEVAARLGGSSGLFRCMGINFALLSVFDAFDKDVSIVQNTYRIELDRALENRYKIDIDYRHVFVDLDDCMLIRGKPNTQLIAFIHQAIGDGKEITLLTRHAHDLDFALKKYRLSELFDRKIHIRNGEKKSEFIDKESSIFIDDSFSERQDVANKKGISTFSPDMVEALLR